MRPTSEIRLTYAPTHVLTCSPSTALLAPPVNTASPGTALSAHPPTSTLQLYVWPPNPSVAPGRCVPATDLQGPHDQPPRPRPQTRQSSAAYPPPTSSRA